MTGGERDLWLELSHAYAGRPTITLTEFLRDFHGGGHGDDSPLKIKTARNRIYARTFPVPVLHDRILLRDVARWLHLSRTKIT